MNSNELRIGSYVELSSEAQRIASINSDNTIRLKDSFSKEHGCYRIKKINPIPLTEEWLLRLGFNKNDCPGTDTHFIYRQNGIGIFATYNTDFSGPTETRICRSIKSVHQLQNLYFALTGTELECAP